MVAEQLWSWLAAPQHRALLVLWVEAYARSLVDPEGPWADFARSTVADWLVVLSSGQPGSGRPGSGQFDDVAAGTLVLAVLRGAQLDPLATGDQRRVDAAVHEYLKTLRQQARGATGIPHRDQGCPEASSGQPRTALRSRPSVLLCSRSTSRVMLVVMKP